MSHTGQVVAGVPLNYHLDDKQFPIEASVSGNRAILTPVTDSARAVKAVPAAALRDIASYKSLEERDKAAWETMTKQVGFSVTIGAIVAAGVGCLIGGVVAAPSAVLTAAFGPIAGCVAGAVVMAPIGALGGTLFVAGPVAVASAIQYFTTVNAPFAPA